MIGKFLQHVFPGLLDHLSDDRLASLFCKELKMRERLVTELHLRICGDCRMQRTDLEGSRAEQVLDFYRRAVNGRNLAMQDAPRAEFARRLERHPEKLSAAPTRPRRFTRVSAHSLLAISPALAVCLVCALTAAISFWTWRRQEAPKITSIALLHRAGQWDTPDPGGTAGVVYQAVRITSPHVTMHREIYRDLQGKHTQRKVALSEEQKALEADLAQAGVDWNEPISAKDYQQWRGHQAAATDTISREGEHLLKLTTSVANSAVTAQSLTVRDTDFHPVGRTVHLREAGTVEIAELDFKILPWSAVRADTFEPLLMPTVPSFVATDRARGLELPKLPSVLSPLQLDEAELSARFLLNQLHADSGEQIEIERESQGIVIRGIVDSEERKRELQRQVALLPHVRFAVQDASELRFDSEGKNAPPAQIATMPNQDSALELFMHRHGRSVAESNSVARQLADTVLTVSQESRAILALQTRFLPTEKRSVIAAATLSELIYTHGERLRTALQEERTLLTQLSMSTADRRQGTTVASTLSVETARNLALLKELTQTDHLPERPAEEILTEMAACLDGASIAANHIFGIPETAAASGGDK